MSRGFDKIPENIDFAAQEPLDAPADQRCEGIADRVGDAARSSRGDLRPALRDNQRGRLCVSEE
jgi:hypothetical protein